jgi:hypothetical protein
MGVTRIPCKKDRVSWNCEGRRCEHSVHMRAFRKLVGVVDRPAQGELYMGILKVSPTHGL